MQKYCVIGFMDYCPERHADSLMKPSSVFLIAPAAACHAALFVAFFLRAVVSNFRRTGDRSFLAITMGYKALQQGFRFNQVVGVKALAEPAIDFRQYMFRLDGLALSQPQAGQTRGRSQFE